MHTLTLTRKATTSHLKNEYFCMLELKRKETYPEIQDRRYQKRSREEELVRH
jgi:hypothetical protein